MLQFPFNYAILIFYHIVVFFQSDWHVQRRRLLRFSSSTWNFGTADFRPELDKQNWEWHLCHA